ncbi:MAG: ATP-dependent helicase HrpB [Kiritimatiellae bacterium]|nr:ATP-dependent helicase HrpB [Kiritimatiellia bacterium]
MAFPVEEKIDDIRRALAANRDVVLTAPPGSGKTTCVPPALLDEPWLKGKKLIMLEPRRLAARNCATYIARKRGETVGGTIGYQVRLERKISAATRLEIVTEGLLTQRLLSDPELSDVGLVIFDEFHERSLPCDTAFALALEVRRALRPDLRILVMSATLDADEVAAHLGDADIIRAEGRMFPVETNYLGDMSMTAAISKALKETDGDILCFLPGEGEIRRLQDTVDVRGRLGTGAPTIDVLPLYGALPKEEQDRVFAPSNLRKVILATSIAETSVTIEEISTVIDSGLMRVPRFRSASGMSGLVTLPLTQDRAEQRRGRAGRVRAGVCYRLWSEGEQQSRPKKMMPEILDADLCSLVLTSAAWGALGREDLPWMTPPPASNWDQAVGLLKMLGALDGDGRLTKKGVAMAKLPMHPRLANMVLGDGRVEHVDRAEGVGVASLLAAIVEEGNRSRETDIRKIAEEIKETPNRPFSKRVLQLARRFQKGSDPSDTVTDTAKAAISYCSQKGLTLEGSLLALAYPDRVAKNRGNGTFRMVSGRGAFVDETDPLSKSPYLVCCELDDRAGDAKVFLGCPIDEDEIEDLFGDRIIEEPYCAWDRQNDRVKSVVRRKLGEMTLGEKPLSAADASHSVDVDTRESEALLDGIRQKGVENLPCWTKESRQMRARLRFVCKTLGESWPDATDDAMLAALPGFISGMTKWKDLERLDLFSVLDFILAEAGHDRRELDRLAPTRMEVPSGSHMLIHYEGDEPTCEVRLQECFGLMETPKVAGGKVPVVMTLLSPAQRPIQITKDLAGFWREGYQLVRKDMRGRYPKHYWPEDPFTAIATRRTVKRAGQT